MDTMLTLSSIWLPFTAELRTINQPVDNAIIELCYFTDSEKNVLNSFDRSCVLQEMDLITILRMIHKADINKDSSLQK